MLGIQSAELEASECFKCYLSRLLEIHIFYSLTVFIIINLKRCLFKLHHRYLSNIPPGWLRQQDSFLQLQSYEGQQK